MKRIHTEKSCLALGIGMAVLASSLLWSASVMAYDYTFSGESNTIFRARKSIDNKSIMPAYEYLRLGMTDNLSDGSGVSFYLGAWGRADLADKTSNNPEGDLQYAYLTYRAPKNNTVATIGRQFVTEGVAAERIDGLYLRSDFDYGFGASVFFGKTVLTEPIANLTPIPVTNPTYKGGSSVYGSRISHTNKKYYTIGLSALKSDYEMGGRYREEEGLDLWLRPLEQIDITGRSSYNSITKGWMESNYAVTYSPLSTLRFGADFMRINFTDYLAGVTTSALSAINPVWKSNEKLTALGTSAAYTGIKDLAVSVDYKFYTYDKSGDAAYFGGKASYALPEAFVIGGGYHRMDGGIDKLRYNEFRVFATKKIDLADLTIDATNINYDQPINGIRNSYAITGAAGYEVNKKLKLGADLEVSRNPDFNSEVRGLIKATYTFDTKLVAEGGTKSEK